MFSALLLTHAGVSGTMSLMLSNIALLAMASNLWLVAAVGGSISCYDSATTGGRSIAQNGSSSTLVGIVKAGNMACFTVPVYGSVVIGGYNVLFSGTSPTYRMSHVLRLNVGLLLL